ncbi:MAC/perforin domain protein (macronuclear) [Tetrahymena thermophila SB210]|uniref:MAC/perforin domain protein n=1 Tax=Tetrahymena thermophila (strain SB210) TaxID=312017 RepID=Q23RR2_TETTS|nr:MAC/perforin domain protein [Tetrahymena thermophila SB210]EAR99223.1 MAC/perforin domain protein [Tetrahymena thermophila SB210]|eukprot:XP_001019468.1 MAC/perforin domain protein [Tetrahymena thermophila SB210]
MACQITILNIIIIFIFTPIYAFSKVDLNQAHVEELQVSGNLRQNSNKRQLFQLMSQSIIEEAIQDLCPFPGYQGSYCIENSEQSDALFRNQRKTAYKAQTGQETQQIYRMPQGIGTSFDITTGDLKLPVVQLTYQKEPTEQQVWRDDLTGNQFIIADETDVEQIQLQPDVKIYKNEFDLSDIWTNAVQNGEWFGGWYSQSKDINDVYSKFFKGDQEISIAQLTKNVIRLKFKTDNLKLNKYAQMAVDALPKVFQPQIYNDFLESWGTHISVDTFIGGMIEKLTVFKNCVYATSSFNGNGGLSPDQLAQALNNELHGNKADDYFVARRKVSIDQRLGGNPEDVQNWENTVSLNPALLKINRFVSWDNFIQDQDVKTNLQQAIQNRIESMKQKQANYQQQVKEQRRIENCGPKTAYAVQGNGISTFLNYQITLVQPMNFLVSEDFKLQDSSQCAPGLPFDISKSRCSSSEFGKMTHLAIPKEVRYERDDQGNFRTILREAYGDWVDKGCSVAFVPGFPQFQDFSQYPPRNSRFQMICVGCTPIIVEQTGGKLFKCNCPEF